MSRAKWAVGVILAVVVLATVLGAPEERSGSVNPAAKNVMITLTISKTQGNQPPRVVKMVGQENTRSKMLIGWRLPIPMQSVAAEAGAKPTTNYIYQNVGVSSEITPILLGQGRIQLDGQIEISGARAEQGDKQPLIGTFQQAVRVIATEGKKVRIAEGPDPEGGTVSLDIEAAVLP